jgi:hypothetical protein
MIISEVVGRHGSFVAVGFTVILGLTDTRFLGGTYRCIPRAGCLESRPQASEPTRGALLRPPIERQSIAAILRLAGVRNAFGRRGESSQIDFSAGHAGAHKPGNFRERSFSAGPGEVTPHPTLDQAGGHRQGEHVHDECYAIHALFLDSPPPTVSTFL